MHKGDPQQFNTSLSAVCAVLGLDFNDSVSLPYFSSEALSYANHGRLQRGVVGGAFLDDTPSDTPIDQMTARSLSL